MSRGISLGIAGLLTLLIVTSPARAKDAEPRHPVLQKQLQTIEDAHWFLGRAEERSPKGAQDDIRKARRDVEDAIGQLNAALKSADAPRVRDKQGEAKESSRPLREAQRLLNRANDELKDGADQFKSYRDKARENIQVALKRLDPLVEREASRANEDRREAVGASGKAAELPPAVRQTVQNVAPNLDISEVRREPDGKGAKYYVKGRTPDRDRIEMTVAENGELLKLERQRRGD